MLHTLCVKPPIKKTRYVIWEGKLKWEIDKFAGENRGLMIAEVELPDEKEAIAKPDWLGEEVTGNKRYFNLNLVKHYSEWGVLRK